MPGPEDRHEVAARAVLAGLHLARECVQLADRPLEVFLANLVVGGGHVRAFRFRRPPSLPVHQEVRRAGRRERRVARAARRCLAASRADAGVALVWRNFNACTYSRLVGLRMMSASRRDSRNSCGPSKSRIRMRTEPRPAATCESDPAPATLQHFPAN